MLKNILNYGIVRYGEILTKGTYNMKKLDKAGFICNTILSILYIPVSFFSFLSFMASELTIGYTNRVFIILINIYCLISMLIPLFCIVGILISVILRKKGHSVLSFVVQFLPLIIFGVNLLLLVVAESLPAKI